MDGCAFAGGFDFEGALFGGNKVECMGDHGIDFGVIVVRVVVEKEELFHIALDGEFDDIVDAAMAPATVFGVFFAVVLGVHDENINSFEKFGDFAIFVAGVFKLGSVAAAAKLRIVTMAEMRFVIGEEGAGAS